MRYRNALLVLVTVAGCVPDAGRPDRTVGAYLELVAAEDARPRTGSEGLGVLLRGTDSESAFLRQVAVRGLGRLERGGLVHEIADLLGDPVPAVRAEAANALAQAVHRGDGTPAVEPLLARVALERDPLVRAALARSLGRLRVEPRERGRIVGALRALAAAGDELAPPSTLVGVALGFESLVRGSPGGLSAAAAGLLGTLADYRSASLTDAAADDAARIRRLAISTLAAARRLDHAQVERALRDPDPGVRATAARHLEAVAPGARVELIRRALTDSWAHTRQEAVRQIERLPRTDLLCRYLLAVVEQERSEASRILAIDALAEPCPERGTQLAALAAQAARIEEVRNAAWQVASHALRSLAAVAPDTAAALLPAFARHASPFVRAHAAHAAARLGARETLRALASDPHPNVRVAALPALARFEEPDLRDLLVEQLEEDDPQLLMTAATLLTTAGADARAASRALEAFQRISEARRETWRDARRALLNLIAATGDASLVAPLRPFLRDYDPAVAADVAGMLETWTGRTHAAQPQTLARLDLPSPADLARMERSAVVLHMRSGGAIRIELLPDLAPTNAYRFLRLASEGYFDGLTFHRWAPLFVIQGGSPGANEYQGDAAYTRDELGLQVHWRGTVGLSTRGRDTGDAQIFVNLVDNVRLDHDYTVFGVVTEGMDVVDGVLEGAVIERAEVVVGN